MYEFSSKSQLAICLRTSAIGCLRYCKCTSFQANHNLFYNIINWVWLFAILQMYEFSSKSQHEQRDKLLVIRCLRYCKCTSFQANHNCSPCWYWFVWVVCDTANVRVFKQITTGELEVSQRRRLFAILQMYEFSSKSQPNCAVRLFKQRCLRYCKCTSFQANHNRY